MLNKPCWFRVATKEANTTNLIHHLKQKHPVEYRKDQKSCEERSTNTNCCFFIATHVMDLKFDWGFSQDSKHFVGVCSWESKKHNEKAKSGASPSEWAPLLCLNGRLLNCSTNKIILLWWIFWAPLTEALSVNSLTFKLQTHLCFLLLLYMMTTSSFLHFKEKTTLTALISCYYRCTR